MDRAAAVTSVTPEKPLAPSISSRASVRAFVSQRARRSGSAINFEILDMGEAENAADHLRRAEAERILEPDAQEARPFRLHRRAIVEGREEARRIGVARRSGAPEFEEAPLEP